MSKFNPDDFDLQEELRDGASVTDARSGYSVGISGKWIGYADSVEEGLVMILKELEKGNWYPNIFYVNERGNTDLLRVRPKKRKGVIIGASYKVIHGWV